jgi:hypothetical protein
MPLVVGDSGSCVTDVVVGCWVPAVFCVRVDVGFGRREQILSEHRLRYRRDSDARCEDVDTRARRADYGIASEEPRGHQWLRCAIWAASNPALLALEWAVLKQPVHQCFFFLSLLPSLSAFLVSFCRYTTKYDRLTFHLCVFFSWELPRLDL